MNDIELRTFLAIIESGNLIRASERLNVTQSTVTSRLKALEDEVGQTLMIRHKSGTTLTPAGERLRRYASTITGLWKQAQREASLPNGFRDVCNLACETNMWTGLGDVFFACLKKAAPEIAISVWQGSKRDVEDWMTSGLSDVAVTKTPLAAQRFESIRLANDEQILVATDPEAKIKFNPDYVFIEAGDEFGREHATAYADADTARISFNSFELALQHMQSSSGSGYFPRRAIQNELNNGYLHELKNAPVFEVPAFVVVNSTAKQQWEWFDEVIAMLPSYPRS